MLKNILSTLLLLLPCIYARMLPDSCAEAVRRYKSSGVFQIQLSPINNIESKPFFVFCIEDSSDGDAWTLIQRRMNGNIGFFRSWRNYQHGFGDLRGDFWMGLETIHTLAHHSLHELWIKMETYNKKLLSARYSHFVVGNENQNYALQALGDFWGNTNDSMRKNAGRQFSTWNKVNKDDRQIEPSCAHGLRGGWWYNNCSRSNLNGRYDVSNFSATRIFFVSPNPEERSFKYVHMAIRKIRSEF